MKFDEPVGLVAVLATVILPGEKTGVLKESATIGKETAPHKTVIKLSSFGPPESLTE